MTRKRCFCTPAFKFETATLMIDQEWTPEAGWLQNIDEVILRHWIKEPEDEKGGSTPTTKAWATKQLKFEELESVQRINSVCDHPKNLNMSRPSFI